MSLMIPAGQLARTIITVRCESPHSAPQIECALDEQQSSSTVSNASTANNLTPPSMLPDINSSRLDPSSSRSSYHSGSPTPTPSDVNVERGFDTRGHYVRFSFQSSPPSQTQTPFDNGPARSNSNFDFCPRIAHSSMTPGYFPQQPSFLPSQYAGIPPQTPSPAGPSSSSLEMSSLIPQNVSHLPSAASFCPDNNATFACAPDNDIMNALDSFMGMFDAPQQADIPHFPFDPQPQGQATFPSSHFFGSLSDPVTPCDSSSSSSSCSSSPTTPYDFGLPASTPTADGRCAPSMMGGYTASASTSMRPSPILTNISPAQTARTDGASGRSPESRLLPCPQPGCKRQFKSTSTLTGHMKTHASKGTRFSCSFPPCSEKFSRRHDQLRHEVYKHGKQCEWVCPKCNSFFSYERSLEKHTCTMDKSRRGSIPTPLSN